MHIMNSFNLISKLLTMSASYWQYLQLRVSSLISNAPYILVMDCDMRCNDPSSARQAMCFHLDPKFSTNLAFVQFPQAFGNLSSYDIYGGEMRWIFKVMHNCAALTSPSSIEKIIEANSEMCLRKSDFAARLGWAIRTFAIWNRVLY